MKSVIRKHQSDLENSIKMMKDKLADDDLARSVIKNHHHDLEVDVTMMKNKLVDEPEVTRQQYARVFSAYYILQIMIENEIEITNELALVIADAIRVCANHLPANYISDDYRIHLFKIHSEIVGEITSQSQENVL